MRATSGAGHVANASVATHVQVLLTAGHAVLLKLFMRHLGLSLCGHGAEQLLSCHMLSGHRAVVLPACLPEMSRAGAGGAQPAGGRRAVAAGVARARRHARLEGGLCQFVIWLVSRTKRVLQVSHAHGIMMNIVLGQVLSSA